MRKLGRWAIIGLILGGSALADPNDFELRRLGNPAVDPVGANLAFAGFAKELAAALTSTNLMPPGTLGHAGFSFTAELSVAFLKGASTPTADQFLLPTMADFADRGPLLLPSLHIRKGLPFSFEVGARATWIDRSRMASVLGELRWAVNEGFAYLPDISLRGYAMRLFNTREFDLGAGGLDLGVGKRFAIGGMVTLTPYAGWNLVWVGASSTLVDFNPGRTYAESIATPTTQLQTDVAAYRELKAGENAHNRLYAGVRFIGGIIQLGAELSYSIIGTVSTTDSRTNITSSKPFPAVLALNTTLGLDF